MNRLLVFGIEFLILGVLANIVAHYLIEFIEHPGVDKVVSPRLVPQGGAERGI